jgi:branched-subunit amino acid aminotransferase/4-amino-4-deoxychorismate lyase
MGFDMNQIAVWKCMDGQEDPLRAADLEHGSVNEIAGRLPEGVYTTLRTYRGDSTLYLSRHFDRLEESAALVGVRIRIERIDFKNKLRIAIKDTGFKETRLRIHISLLNKNKPDIYFILEPLTVPSAEEIAGGVSILTRLAHRSNPYAKTSGFLSIADSIKKDVSKEVNEVLMIAEDHICLEGLSSNFYAVNQDVVWTADEGILHGITREVVIQVIHEKNIQLNLNGHPFETIGQLNEAFLSSTSRGVLPVTKIDNLKIGNGLPGPVTETIRKGFDKKILELIEKI